jgi:hypothetical protein
VPVLGVLRELEGHAGRPGPAVQDPYDRSGPADRVPGTPSAAHPTMRARQSQPRTLRAGVRPRDGCLNCAALWLLPMGLLLDGWLAGRCGGCVEGWKKRAPGCGAGVWIRQSMSGARPGGMCDQCNRELRKCPH